jgi:kynurenine formamidase
VQVIDLSVPLMPTPSEATRSRFRRRDHAAGAVPLGFAPAVDRRSVARTIRNVLRGLVTGRRIHRRDFPDGIGLAWETVKIDTHHGTHVDAPWHFGPTSGGARARTIDEMPLDWFIGPGVRLDLRAKPVGATVSPADLERALRAAQHDLQAGDIVLLWTGADADWGRGEYLRRYCGLGGDATRWLLDRGVKVIGTDAWSVDRPPAFMERDFLQTGDPAYLWPAHFVGREREYCQIEKLAHLGDLPASAGWTVACFPVAVEGGSAGWTRAVAIVDDRPSGQRRNAWTA